MVLDFEQPYFQDQNLPNDDFSMADEDDLDMGSDSTPSKDRVHSSRPRSLKTVKKYTGVLNLDEASMGSPIETKPVPFPFKTAVSNKISPSSRALQPASRPFVHHRTNSSLGMNDDFNGTSLKRPLPFTQIHEPGPSKFVFPRPKLPLEEISQNTTATSTPQGSRSFTQTTRRNSIDNIFSSMDSQDVHALAQMTPHRMLHAASPSPSPASTKHIRTIDSSLKPPKRNSHLFNASNRNETHSGQFGTPDYQMVKPLQTAFASTGLLSKRNRILGTPHVGNLTAPAILSVPEEDSLLDMHDSGFLSANNSQNSLGSLGLSHLKPNITGSSPTSLGRGLQYPDFYGSRKFTPDTPVKRPALTRLPLTKQGLTRPGLRDSLLRFSFDSNGSSTPARDLIHGMASRQVSDASTVTLGTPSHHASRSALYETAVDDHLIGSPTTPTVDMTMQFSVDELPKEESVDRKHNEPKTPAKTPVTSNSYMHMANKEADPTLMNRFHRVMLIGRGEFSTVYAVLEHNQRDAMETKYAVKRTKYPFMGLRDRQRRFEEVDILKTLTSHAGEGGHDHIVNLVEAWETNGHLYIMTEFCENGNLETFLLERGNISRLDEWRVWKILVELSTGINYIHQQGFLHLDLKPANIFITFEGILKIGDFGMATKYPVAPGIEREGDREYIAPEVLTMQHYDTPADIFSLGITVLEIAANIVLPDNGIHWQKLRSGDLSEAGRLSSGDLTMIDAMDEDDSLSFEDDDSESGTTVSSAKSDLLTSLTTSRSARRASKRKLQHSRNQPPSWAPKFMVDNTGALDHIVKWMLEPDPQKRPSAHDILCQREVQLVEATRKAGAIIYEGDYGPEPDTGAEEWQSRI